MKEQFLNNPVEVRTAVAKPRFGDWRVLQRAQRVVPLKDIRTKLRLRRLSVLSAAVAIAMVLGAASALVAVRVKRIAAINDIPHIEEPQTTATADVPAPDPIADSAFVESAQVQPVRRAPKRDTLVAKPWIVDTPPTVNGRAPSEDEQLQQIRDAVLYQRWQEQRARRATRRSRGDLSRADEIFEGTRRPERP